MIGSILRSSELYDSSYRSDMIVNRSDVRTGTGVETAAKNTS